ncbi:hypothetical protein [Glycomyces sp. NRRL B-16210]|uniref:hypothetical protein n=1 Tax=Glycomyces sp. NRRL B-16210 TaxID=1463821 RepID=UPI0004C20AE7|nr:hypothetical protein [Glycomyces sp. NRRL B-16210]
MRHHRVPERREPPRAFRRAFLIAAVATAAAAAVGYASAHSALAGWAAIGVGAAVAVSLWMESHAGRTATPPPVMGLSFVQRRGED